MVVRDREVVSVDGGEDGDLVEISNIFGIRES